MPKHQGLERLTCWDCSSRDLHYLLGTYPSPTTTGVLAPWLVRALPDLPSLTRLQLRNDRVAYPEWPPGDFDWCVTQPCDSEPTRPRGFVFKAFEDPTTGHQLVHARIVYPMGNEATYLGHHYASYEPEDLSWDRAIIHDDDLYINPNGPMVVNSEHPYRDDMEGVLDFTSYCGRPLPKSVLRWVYEESGLDWDWTEGARDVRLPDHAWDYLAAWLAIGEASSEHVAGDGKAGEVQGHDEGGPVGRPGESGDEDIALEETAIAENAHDLESYFGDGLRW